MRVQQAHEGAVSNMRVPPATTTWGWDPRGCCHSDAGVSAMQQCGTRWDWSRGSPLCTV